MKGYCSRCQINWASLYEVSDETLDATYEFCPECNTDMFLEDVKPGPQFIKPMIGAGIYNIETKQPLLSVIAIQKPVIQKPAFDREAYQAGMEANEAIQDQALQDYQQVYETQGQAAAEAAYFNILKTQS
jgi:hypothetical protein